MMETFIDKLRIRHEPRTQFGRFFLGVEDALLRRGVTFRQAAFPKLAEVFEANASSNNGLMQCFDSRTTIIHYDEAACFIGYDGDNQPMATMAVRLFDLANTTVKSEFESLRFLYGPQAPKWKDRVSFSITAPSAARLSGKMTYLGAFWLRPDWRGDDLRYLIPDIARYYALSQWSHEYEISIGSDKFSRPELQQCYGFEHHEPGAALVRDGITQCDGFFLWSSAQHVYRRLDRLIDDGPSVHQAGAHDAHAPSLIAIRQKQS